MITLAVACRHVKIATLRTQVLLLICLGMNVGFGFARLLLEPVADVLTGRKHDRVAQRTRAVLSNELRQVEYLVEDGHPDVVRCVVLSDLRGQIETAQLVACTDALLVIFAVEYFRILHVRDLRSGHSGKTK